MNVKTVLFQAVQFRISTKFSSIWPIEKTLSDATTLVQSETLSDGNERVLCILQSITWASPSDCLVSLPGHSLITVLLYCKDVVSVFNTASRLGHLWKSIIRLGSSILVDIIWKTKWGQQQNNMANIVFFL